MGKAAFVGSLAGTDRQYVVGQGTLKGYDGKLHIQVLGEKGNRAYGLSFTTKDVLPVKLAKWFDRTNKPLLSMANTGKAYAVLQLAVRTPGLVHVQIPNGEGNRSYGVTFDIKDAALAAYVESQFKVAEETIQLDDEFEIQ